MFWSGRHNALRLLSKLREFSALANHQIMVSADFADRPTKKLVLFDVDNTLTPARQKASPEMIHLLRELRKKVAIGFVGGSDLGKISDQLAVAGTNGASISNTPFWDGL